MSTIWQLSANYMAIDARGFCNGYPVFDVDVADEGASGCHVEGAQEGQMISTGDAPPLAIPEGDPPHVIVQTFDSEVSGFGELLGQAQPATGAQMCTFALEIRDIINSGDLEAVLKLFRPKFDAYAAAFGEPLEAMLGGITGMFEELLKHKQEFDVEDLDLKPYCDDKLWSLQRKDGNALIRIEEEDGGTYIDICAALLPDGAAIVR